MTIVHRSDRFRAHGATVAQFQAGGRGGARAICSRFTSCTTSSAPTARTRFTHVELRDVKAKTTREIDADVVLPMLGFVSDIGPLAEWGLTLEKDEIVVNSMMETGRAGIYAAGDVTTYPGKLKLIATGFAEAATAVNQAVHWIYPERRSRRGTRRTWRSSGRRTIERWNGGTVERADHPTERSSRQSLCSSSLAVLVSLVRPCAFSRVFVTLSFPMSSNRIRRESAWNDSGEQTRENARKPANALLGLIRGHPPHPR